MVVSRRTVVIIVASTVVAGFAYWLYWRSPSVQVPALFADLERAVEGGDPGATIGTLHPDYDAAGHWPVLAEYPLGEPRLVARQALAALYRQHADDPLRLDWSVTRIVPRDDGTVEVSATVVVNATRGGVAVELGPIDGHRFVLARTGFGGLRILRHDPISLTRQ